jgi:hypothetical protein
MFLKFEAKLQPREFTGNTAFKVYCVTKKGCSRSSLLQNCSLIILLYTPKIFVPQLVQNFPW